MHVSEHEENWVDLVIDKSTNTANIELRVNIKDGGKAGVGEEPPNDVKQTTMYKNAGKKSPQKSKHIRLKSAADLRNLAISGLNQYWSRQNVPAANGSTYNIKVGAVHTDKLSMDDIDVKYNTNRKFGRSSNPGKVRGFISLFGNFVPERIIYNVGWIKYSNGWGYVSQHDAEKDFKETAAHEIGHEILSAYAGGAHHSYTHKGSSSLVSQETKKMSDGGVAYPASGEIDLMKYYNFVPGQSNTRGYYSRVHASETDVKSLIWLNRLKAKLKK